MNNSSKQSKTTNLRQKAETLLGINSSETGLPISEIETVKLVQELEVHWIQLELIHKELIFLNEEKEKRAAELIIANKELAFQNKEKEKRANELIIANKELAFQNKEKEKRAAELIIANKELAFQNEEKEKRAAELIVANKELAFQNREKVKRAYELIIANKELNNSHLELRKFASHLQNVREEEKTALAREIHDDLGQILVALKIDLGMFERKLSKGIESTTTEERLSKLNDLSDQVDNTIKSARRIMNGLRPELIELLGFEAACKSYLHDFEETHHISSQFESTILNLNINWEQSVALFRILQEALTNVAKHAKATLVTVQLSNPAGKLMMVIIDNGVGFDENNKGRQDSYGMIGMKERVFLLEGELDITSKAGKGTSVRVEIPYHSIHHSVKL